MSKKIKNLYAKLSKTSSKNNGKITIPIVHCFDNNYVIPASVSFFSMLQNANKSFNYALYVLHTDISSLHQEKLTKLVNCFDCATIQFINMKNKFDDIWKSLKNKEHYSKEVLYKLLLPSIFPNYDRIIVTDVDVIFLGDISNSYFCIDSNESDIYLGGVKHVFPTNSWLDNYYKQYDVIFGKGTIEKLKICGGYLVMNLKNLRENKIEKQFINYLKNNSDQLIQPEQDVFNFCCEEKNIKYLPLNNLVCSYCYDIFTSKELCSTDKNYSSKKIINALQHPIQLHFATNQKPWNNPSIKMAELWFLYLAKTNFFEEYIDMKLSNNLQQNKLIKRIYNKINKKL